MYRFIPDGGCRSLPLTAKQMKEAMHKTLTYGVLIKKGDHLVCYPSCPHTPSPNMLFK